MATYLVFNKQKARAALPKRSKENLKKSHKGSFGHLLVCAGSTGTWGAGILSSSSAFRMGLGYVTWASFQKPDKQIRAIPEVLVGKLPDAIDAQIAKKSNSAQKAKKFSAFLVGPGLGVGRRTLSLISILLKQDQPVVLDADALTVLSQFKTDPKKKSKKRNIKNKIGKLKPNWILTPHHGEMARLLNINTKAVEKNRHEAVKAAAQKYQCVVLLKGFPTLVSDGVKTFEVHKGNAALAKAGSGDVLAGMLGSLLAQGVNAFDAACLAAYIHGDVADQWIKTKDIRSMKASDIIDSLPVILKRLSKTIKI